MLTLPTHVICKIADIDKTNYTISVKENKGAFKVDIETTTKTYQLGKDNALIKAGFSKFKIGDVVSLQGTSNPKEENSLIAERVIIVASSLTQTTITPSPTSSVKKTTPVPTTTND